ncbi:MAG: Wzt carbohydrate-binding domain-containing protein [Proteobacteria bacterium]|nr:Wzt carbohydrate-binding domain-containing protein [Pseudomonadota bacterium]
MTNAEFCDFDGRKLSYIEGEQDVCFVVRVRAESQIQRPAVAVILKDRQGQFLFTESSDLHFRKCSLSMARCEEAEVHFKFRMPLLIRGSYTLDIAFADGIVDDHVQHHWIHDAIQIQCTHGRHVVGIVGFSNLTILWKTQCGTKK